MALLDDVAYLLSETDAARLGPCAAEVAFIGRSNVGKSTLLNALCRRDLARVSSTPGRTRTINVFHAGRDKDRWLVDLPGYGYAEGPRASKAGWGAMVRGYLTGRPSLRVIYALLDSKVGPTSLDIEVLRWMSANSLPVRLVATKTDQLKASKAAARRREMAEKLNLHPHELAWVSAEKNWGIQELRAEASAVLAG